MKIIDILENIGPEMKKYRKEKGLSMERMGFRLGLGEATVSNYEKGITSPHLKAVIRFLKLLKAEGEVSNE